VSASRKRWLLSLLTLAWIAPAHASLLEGDALDTLANIIAWIAILIVPVVVVGVFWWLHIMPEKIAEKRKHPQLQAIKIICLLSLVFGGMLWPIAWIWAYTKPVLHKMAYGTDVEDAHGHGGDAISLHPEPIEEAAAPAPAAAPSEDVAAMRRQIASLEMQLAAASAQAQGRGPGAGAT
jgi:CBS domain containing-hemolysin-like protein